MEFLSKIKQYLIDKTEVYVILSDEIERGHYVYAIAVKDDPDFWLDAFKTLNKTKEHIKKYDLKWNGSVYDMHGYETSMGVMTSTTGSINWDIRNKA